MNINNLYLLGDSFTAQHSDPTKNESQKIVFWVNMLRENYNVFLYAEASRDLQTILDTWVKLLPKLKENDCIVIGFPYFSRWRLPRDEKYYKIENEQIVRHISQHGFGGKQLEFLDKNNIVERLRENEIINSSKASSLNNKELIESLTEVSKCKVVLWSWTRFEEGFKPNGLYDKTDLEKELGYWGTMQDVFDRTNGNYGQNGDLHWDEKTQELFYQFIKKVLI